MKKLLLMATMLLAFGAANAQIAEVKEENGMAKIYNDQGSFTGNYISLCSNCYVKNVSASAILVKEGSMVKYYDFKGSFTGKYTND